jgi:hypothetical protein
VATLSIPERYQEGVSKIRDLDMEHVRQLKTILDRPGLTEAAEAATSTALQTVLPKSAPGDDKKIAEALIAMYLVKSSQDIDLGEFAEHIADALEILPNPALRLPANEKESFKQKLSTLLRSEVFVGASKVFDLQTESEHVFCHARILTDLRPVFGTEIEKGPRAVVVTHNLKIAFHLSGRKGDHDFYVMLDASDLAALKKVILRAEAKAKTLRAIIKDDITLLGGSE